MTESPANPPPVERRSGRDRRERPTAWLSRFWLRGRRRGGRRATDAQQPYVDRYQWSDVLLVGGILVLCAADYLLTVGAVARGAIEANPIMDFFVQQGSGVFGLVKVGFTAFGMYFLLLHIRLKGVRAATFIVLGLYAALMLWHLWVGLDMHRAFAAGAGS